MSAIALFTQCRSTDLNSGGELSSPVNEDRLATRSVLDIGLPTGDVGANSSNAGEGNLLSLRPSTFPVYSYRLLKRKVSSALM